MRNFDLYNPTKILFGKGQIAAIAKEIPQGAKILLLYGGGSIKNNGVYQQVIDAIKGYDVVEFSGVMANPEYSVLIKALEVIKKENITFILAVGGGSVIDGAKFLSSAAIFEGDEPWDILSKGIRTDIGMPFGTVLTLPATGSEMNSSSVISRKEIGEKRAMGGPGLFPKFSVLDPSVVASVPLSQLQNGIIDAMTHVLEQYMTFPIGADLQDRIAESIISSLIDVSKPLLENPSDYTVAANYMWCCTMALNGLIQKGVPSDWSVHMIGHELTAMYGIDHARTLAIVLPSAYRHRFESKKQKLAQFAERICGISNGTVEQKANKAIDFIKHFCQSLGVKTKLSDYAKEYEGTAEKVQSVFEKRGWLALGENGEVTPKDVVAILKNCY